MGTRGLRLLTVMALALAAALVLAWSLSATATASDIESGREQQSDGVAWQRTVTTRPGGYQRISSALTGIAARRAISDPGINSPLTLADNGRRVVVAGHVTCTRGEDYEIQATVTQRATGAMARGWIQGRCTGRTEQFEAPAWVYDAALFQAGKGQACALLITRNRTKITDVFQWCRKEDADLATAAASY